MSEKNKFELKGHSYSLGDTGDYDGHWEITNGKMVIYTKDDFEEGLQAVADALNNSECDFYLDDSLSFINHELKAQLQQVEQENSNLKDALSSSDTIIEGLGKSIKLKEEENKRLRKSLEAMKSIIEQDLIANGNNDLGNRLHIEICVGLKQQP